MATSASDLLASHQPSEASNGHSETVKEVLRLTRREYETDTTRFRYWPDLLHFYPGLTLDDLFCMPRNILTHFYDRMEGIKAEEQLMFVEAVAMARVGQMKKAKRDQRARYLEQQQRAGLPRPEPFRPSTPEGGVAMLAQMGIPVQMVDAQGNPTEIDVVGKNWTPSKEEE